MQAGWPASSLAGFFMDVHQGSRLPFDGPLTVALPALPACTHHCTLPPTVAAVSIRTRETP